MEYKGGDASGSAPYGGAITPPKPQPAPAAPVAPPPAASSSGGGGNATSSTSTNPYSGTVPPIDQILGSDPNYQQLLSFDTASSGEDQATMNARIARMQGYYGNDNDPLSILGRVYQAYQDRNRYIANTLAGHGMINSGETGWQGSRATLDYQRAEYDARMKLQDYIDGLQEAFRQAERQRKFNEMQASWAAVQSYIAGHPPTASASSSGGGGGGSTTDVFKGGGLGGTTGSPSTGGYLE